MRVALFSEVYWPMISGVSATLQRLCDALRSRGHALRVYTATYPLPPGSSDVPETRRSPSQALLLSPEVQWASPRRRELGADLTGFAPDIVHLATEFPMGYAGLQLARQFGLPVIASAHTDYERYASRYGLEWAVPAGWAYLRWFYRQAGLVLCPSETHRRHLRNRGIHHTALWTRGVDAETFHPQHRSEAYRARFGAGPDDTLVTYVGRVAPEKGIESLLDAWSLLGDGRGRAQLVFVGRGLMEKSIRRRGLPGVHLTGVQRGSDLSRAYASADVLVFPSATETFGNVLLEGMSSGLACLAMNAGGITEFARDGENALLVAPGDTRGLALGLARLLSDRTLRHDLGTAARHTALSRRWGPIFDQLITDYEQVIADARRIRAA